MGQTGTGVVGSPDWGESRDLGNGLVLRRSAPADAGALAALLAMVFGEPGRPAEAAAISARDLLTRPHPTFGPGDFTLVVDTRTNEGFRTGDGSVVSATCLIGQTWSYAGIPIAVGRPESVATHPDYRGRGLVREQFKVVHEWAARRGQRILAITGIPHFYRQFGYEMTMPLDGGLVAHRSAVPKLAPGELEPYQTRPAEIADIPFLSRLYDRSAERYLVACIRDETMWRHELVGRGPDNPDRDEIRVVETPSAEPVGFLVHHRRLEHGALGAVVYELAPGVSWHAVTPSVLRYLVAAGDTYSPAGSGEQPSVALLLGEDHPAYATLSAGWIPHDTYAWYVRVPDLPGFLGLVAPVLERRLAGSPAAGYSGDVTLSFYRSGLRLAFAAGRLVSVDSWLPRTPYDESTTAHLPYLTFLHLLFGHRSVAELQHAYADCLVRDAPARRLLDALFPKQTSNVWPVV